MALRDPDTSPRSSSLVAIVLGGCGLLLGASLACALAGLGDVSPPSVLAARLGAFVWGPVGAWIVAAGLVAMAADSAQRRPAGAMAWRAAGCLVAAAGVAGIAALPHAANAETVREGFARGGLMGSLLTDYRALDLGWRIGATGAYAVLAAMVAAGAAIGIHALRHRIAGVLTLASAGRRERQESRGLKVIEDGTGRRCYGLDRAAERDSSRGAVAAARPMAQGASPVPAAATAATAAGTRSATMRPSVAHDAKPASATPPAPAPARTNGADPVGQAFTELRTELERQAERRRQIAEEKKRAALEELRGATEAAIDHLGGHAPQGVPSRANGAGGTNGAHAADGAPPVPGDRAAAASRPSIHRSGTDDAALAAAEQQRAGLRIFAVDRAGTRPDPEAAASAAANAAAQEGDAFEPPVPAGWFARYAPPPLSLLAEHRTTVDPISEEKLLDLARRLQSALHDFGVEAQVTEITQGPVVTLLELNLAAGTKVARIVSLETDLALTLRTPHVRILAPIPGKSAVGVEIPHEAASPVVLRDVIGSESFWSDRAPLLFGLGVAVDGAPYLCNLARLPHLLIAGATGSGKSVSLNALIASILYHMTPELVRFVLIDPKRVELNIYEDIPHLAAPIISEPEEAAAALAWLLDLMDERFRRLQTMRVRNIEGYNQIALGQRKTPRTDMTRPAYLPHVVVVIDELADLMIVQRGRIEDSLVRLAQKARAVGIHLVVATQRPSVDVITGLIKANFPARIAFQVSSKVDSRTILDSNGAECLRGGGDMLFSAGGAVHPIRIQGAFIADDEVERLAESLRASGRPWYWCEDFGPWMEDAKAAAGEGAGGDGGGAAAADDGRIRDELYYEALRAVMKHREPTQAGLVRRLNIGRTNAGRLLDRMEQEGFVAKRGRGLELAVNPDLVLERLAENERRAASGA